MIEDMPTSAQRKEEALRQLEVMFNTAETKQAIWSQRQFRTYVPRTEHVEITPLGGASYMTLNGNRYIRDSGGHVIGINSMTMTPGIMEYTDNQRTERFRTGVIVFISGVMVVGGIILISDFKTPSSLLASCVGIALGLMVIVAGAVRMVDNYTSRGELHDR